MLLLLSILSSLFLAALANDSNNKRHLSLAQSNGNGTALEPRWTSSFAGARATWYQTGLYDHSNLPAAKLIRPTVAGAASGTIPMTM